MDKRLQTGKNLVYRRNKDNPELIRRDFLPLFRKIINRSFMPFLELFDETLDINSTESYELSLQISHDYLSFSILDTLRNKYVMLRSYEAEEGGSYDANKLGELLSMDDFLIRRFRKTVIVTPSDRSTLVPAPLYDETLKDSFFLFNHPDFNGHDILVNELSEPEAFLVFAIPSDINELIKRSFPRVNPYHQLKPLLRFFSANRRITGSNPVNVHIEKGFLCISVFDQNTLRFCNTFNYQTGSDIRYFILYVFKRLGLSQDENVFFSGRISRHDDIMYGLSDYLRNIKFSQPSGNFTMSYVFNETEVHKFLNLFITSDCE